MLINEGTLQSISKNSSGNKFLAKHLGKARCEATLSWTF